MFYGELDYRKPLSQGAIVEFPEGTYVVDKYLGAGGFALAYIAHKEGYSRYIVLKELFPRTVERGVAERRPDGRIVIYDPATQGQDIDDSNSWNEVIPYLYHEADMTKKAMATYRCDGLIDKQNNPDIFDAYGPLQDRYGNHYLIISTAQGEPLRDLIQNGFVRNDEGKILTNGNLSEILDLLLKLTKRLSKLHGDNKMLHLDLSPENIYVAYTGGGSELTPFLIDYGSAYDREKTNLKTPHRFTLNPYSAPEIMALADFNDEAAGYSPDESSDTYSIVSILFFALTGQVFSTKMLFNTSWKKDLLSEYFFSDTDGELTDSFSKQLVAVFEKGLATDQKRRFLTANDLYRALNNLKRSYEKTGNLLNLMEKDELISYVMLEKYPLYAYQSDDAHLDVLCLGSGQFVRRMILSMISCGQMLNRTLRIHVISADAPKLIKQALLAQAPALAHYSDIENNEILKENPYVSFSFEYVADLLDPEQYSRIATEYAFCRYIIISLGRNNSNIDLARLYGKEISKSAKAKDGKYLVLYYNAEDVASNTRSDVDTSGIADNILLNPFGENIGSYASSIRSLGRRALRLSYLYELLSDPHQALSDAAFRFMTDKYAQRSSCASALHLKYKLASIGINPAPSTNRRAIISAYQKAIKKSELRNELVYLEHRRWMMYMIADGYQMPTIHKIDEYSFKGSIYSFKDTTNLWHHCLVPSSASGIVLSSLDHSEWDKYRSFAEIDDTDFDELDKMSLKLHLLSSQKMKESRILEDMKAGIGSALDKWVKHFAEVAADPSEIDANEERPEAFIASQLQAQYDELYISLEALFETGSYSKEIEKLDCLEESFKEAGIDVTDAFSIVRNDLKVFVEFASYHDYKAPDATIIDHLLWLLYANEELTMIKLSGRTVTENIISAICVRPSDVVFWGRPMAEFADIVSFLRGHGNRGKISFSLCESEKLETATKDLEAIIKQTSGTGRCIIDITGGDPLLVAASMTLAMTNKKVGVICYNHENQAIDNIQGFYEAAAYNLPSSISADEIYSLYGAKADTHGAQYMRELMGVSQKLWDFYREFQRDWEMITAFFYSRGTGTPELKLRFNPQASDDQFSICTEYVDKYRWNDLQIEECFRKMNSMGLIRDLAVTSRGGRLAVSFQSPIKANIFDGFFRDRIWYSKTTPFVMDVGKGKDDSVYIQLQSGYYVDFFDTSGVDFSDKRQQREGGGKRFAYELMRPALKRMEELGLIYNLQYNPQFVSGQRTGFKISYVYSDLSVKRCLMTAGNVLELYAWSAAQETGYFDDCRANFSFMWREGIRNELDLILTKGISALVVSCKTAKFKKEHLYEIKYLTEKFDLNSQAVIIYSSSQMVGDDGRLYDDLTPVKERAKAMGIFLIDLNEVNPQSLGQIFVSISKGEYPL